MAPTIHCIRHAQGYHNLTVANHSMHDPLLTSFGEEQCQDLARNFPYHASVDLVVASPIKRTIYTALLGFGEDLTNKNMKVIGLPELQETSDLPCDTGSSPDELAKEFDGHPVDLHLVKPGWDSKRMKWAPTARAIENRARDARLWLMNRPEKEIVVVTHGGFLHYLTEDWTGSDRFNGTGWANTESRSYTFSTHDPDNAHLIETPASRQRRAGHEHPLDANEKVNLNRTSPHEKLESNGEVRANGERAPEIQAKV